MEGSKEVSEERLKELRKVVATAYQKVLINEEKPGMKKNSLVARKAEIQRRSPECAALFHAVAHFQIAGRGTHSSLEATPAVTELGVGGGGGGGGGGESSTLMCLDT